MPRTKYSVRLPRRTQSQGNNSPLHNSQKREGCSGLTLILFLNLNLILPYRVDHNRKAIIRPSTTHKNAEGAPGSLSRAWVSGLTLILFLNLNLILPYRVDHNRKAIIRPSTTHKNAEGAPG